MGQKNLIIKNVYCPKNPDNQQLEVFYEEYLLKEYGIVRGVTWHEHIATGPDNFIHTFEYQGEHYVLAYDDYPSGFSVDGNYTVQWQKIRDSKEAILAVATPNHRFEMNVTGYFMLFRVVDSENFDGLVSRLILDHQKLQQDWKGSGGTVAIASDILQLAETAARNHDGNALHALQNMITAYESYKIEDSKVPMDTLSRYVDMLLDMEFGCDYCEDKGELKKTVKEIYQTLSRQAQLVVSAQKYESTVLDEMVTLASALYGKEQNGKTAGISVSVLFDGDEIRYPLEHFVNIDLKDYFSKNLHISANNIEHHMPETLQDYKLVQGSLEVQKLFRRELEYISF